MNRTDAQRIATKRNWGIRCLRAFYRLSYQLSPGRGEAVRKIVDDELAERGAETERQRSERHNAEIMEMVG